MATGALAQLDNAFPKFTGDESAETKITTIMDYLYQQNEVIRYLLGHIDLTNITEQAQTDLTAPIHAEIVDAENNLSTKIDVQAGRVSSIVTSIGKDGKVTAASIIEAINGDSSEITLDADKIDLLGITNVAETLFIGNSVNGLALNDSSGMNISSYGNTQFTTYGTLTIQASKVIIPSGSYGSSLPSTTGATAGQIFFLES